MLPANHCEKPCMYFLYMQCVSSLQDAYEVGYQTLMADQ
jgi:hypothetical protein